VCRLIEEREIPTIYGNYDYATARELDDCGCAYVTQHDSGLGQQSVAWTVIAAPYAALVLEREQEYAYALTPTVQVFDLRTGSLKRGLGGERTTYCYSAKYQCVPKEFGPLVLDSDGLTAVHVRAI
jgi:hypothetical protein